MKYLSLFFGFVLVSGVIVYNLLFTPYGNDILKPIVQEQLSSETKHDIKLEKFRINRTDIDMKINIDDKYVFLVRGKYSLFSQSLHLDINSVKILGIFSAQVNGVLDYDLKVLSGVFIADIKDGQFSKNRSFELVKKYIKFDMYREKFDGILRVDIDKSILTCKVDLNSKSASIKTNDAKVYTKSKTIDADVAMKAKNDDVEFNLSGDINTPKITINMEKLMNSSLGKKVNSAINKFFNKLF